MDPYLRHRERVAEKLTGTRLRRSRLGTLVFAAGLAFVVAFWFVIAWWVWELTAATGISGQLTAAAGRAGLPNGEVAVTSNGTRVATLETTTPDGGPPQFDIGLEPGIYRVDVTLVDGRRCGPEIVTVADRGYSEVVLWCRAPTPGSADS